MRHVYIWALPVLLAGCAPSVPPVPTGLTRPAPELMVPPPPRPVSKAGEKTFQAAAQCEAALTESDGKLVGLQRWAARVTRK